MTFSIRRMAAVARKDVLDLRKNRGLLWSLAALPAVIVAVPVAVVAAYARRPDDPSLRVMAQFYDSAVTGSQAARFLVDRVLTDWFTMFLMMPVFVPILISAHAIAGEKEKRTLEPLLNSPVTALELVLGKSLASLIPSVCVCLAAFVVLCVGVDVVAWELVQAPLLPNALWLFGVLVVAPLFAFFGNGVAVVISARVGDSRLAQQLSGLFVLPLVGLASGQFAGWLQAGPAYYAAIAMIVLGADVGLLFAARRLFDRERLLSRWG
jgi:ABC-type Na+ efflux pump permease subunit